MLWWNPVCLQRLFRKLLFPQRSTNEQEGISLLTTSTPAFPGSTLPKINSVLSFSKGHAASPLPAVKNSCIHTEQISLCSSLWVCRWSQKNPSYSLWVSSCSVHPKYSMIPQYHEGVFWVLGFFFTSGTAKGISSTVDCTYQRPNTWWVILTTINGQVWVKPGLLITLFTMISYWNDSFYHEEPHSLLYVMALLMLNKYHSLALYTWLTHIAVCTWEHMVIGYHHIYKESATTNFLQWHVFHQQPLLPSPAPFSVFSTVLTSLLVFLLLMHKHPWG